MEKPNQLAPAAGSGIGKSLADDLLTDPQFLPLMAKTARECLNATSQRWDKDAKCWQDVPDWRTRAQMFFGLLAHMEGEPVKRILHHHTGDAGTTEEGLKDALKGSAALRDAARRMLDNAEHHTKKPARHERRAEAVEIEAAPAVA